MKSCLKDMGITVRAFARTFDYLARAPRHLALAHEPAGECDVPSDFFGICVAGAEDNECEDYVVARLKDLAIRCVRVDAMRANCNERFLRRLLDEKFHVCLHLVQPLESDMVGPGAQERWREFVVKMLDEYGKRAALVEIGSTCNRRKWSGYTVPSYLASWRTAWAEAKRSGVPLAGPNVTDFEPFYNIALLGEMKRSGMLPAAHTDNLFVERAVEPEAYDHKIMGRAPAGLLRFNLIKKAGLLSNISDWAGVSETICSQVSWSLRRIARLHEEVEEKQADYVARYCCLAAASGALRRVYWGPLIGQREGLIDDGTDEFPDIPHVAFYGAVNGRVADFRKRPAFSAFETVNRLIAGTRFKRKYRSGTELQILEFESADRLIHAIWTRDGRCARASDCYETGALRQAAVYSRDGSVLNAVPDLLTESPIYVSWPLSARARAKKAIHVTGTIFANVRNMAFTTIDVSPWSGAMLKEDEDKADALSLISLVERCGACPGKTEQHGAGVEEEAPAVLRASRNLVWREPAPWDEKQTLVFKRFRPRGRIRRILDAHKRDKAQRSWNGAQELLRRGVMTPLPVAFFHKTEEQPNAECYFVCHAFEEAFSVRDAFEAFSAGSDRFQGERDSDFYKSLGRFLLKMHDRGVFFRDLSAGNVLCRPAAPGKIEFALIDTGRARFYPKSLGLHKRLCDLMRVCHPLHGAGRAIFLAEYMELHGRRFRTWMKTPFIYYDLKHRLKNAINPLRKRLSVTI